MASARITVVGSLNTDYVVSCARAPGAGETVIGGGFARHAGGKGANQAAAAARAADPDRATVALIGRVGNDPEGDFLATTLADAGVRLAGLGRDPTFSTGIAAITVAGAGENRIVVVPGANQALTPAILGQHHDVLVASDVILTQLEIPLPTVQTATRMGREKRAIVILDPAPARPLPAALLRLVDYVTPNETELATLTGRKPADGEATPSSGEIAAAARALLAQGARKVVVKLGARGALLVSATGERHWPAFPVTARDTTAAGDAWNGAFAVALAEGQDEDSAGRFANAAAALSVTRAGAIPSLATRAEIETLLASGG